MVLNRLLLCCLNAMLQWHYNQKLWFFLEHFCLSLKNRGCYVTERRSLAHICTVQANSHHLSNPTFSTVEFNRCVYGGNKDQPVNMHLKTNNFRCLAVVTSHLEDFVSSASWRSPELLWIYFFFKLICYTFSRVNVKCFQFLPLPHLMQKKQF